MSTPSQRDECGWEDCRCMSRGLLADITSHRCRIAAISARTRQICACTDSCNSMTMGHGVIDRLRMAVSQPLRRRRTHRTRDTVVHALSGYERDQLSHSSYQSSGAGRTASTDNSSVVAQISASPHIARIVSRRRRSREGRPRSFDNQIERADANRVAAFRHTLGVAFREIRRCRSTAREGTFRCSTHRHRRDKQHSAPGYMELQASRQSSNSSCDCTSMRNRRITLS